MLLAFAPARLPCSSCWRRPLLVPPAAVSRFRAAAGRARGAAARAAAAAARPVGVPRPARRLAGDARPARRVGAAVAVLLAAADGARARRPGRRRRGRGRAVRGQRDRGDPGDARRTSASSRPPAWRCSAAPTTSRTPDAIAYGIVLQAVEVATALIMGLPALLERGPLLARRAAAHDARHARCGCRASRTATRTALAPTERHTAARAE